MAECIHSYCKNRNLLIKICTSAKIQPGMYRIMMKFVPYNGTFSPKDDTHLHIVELNHNLKHSSILSASWIKKPKHCTPNQKTANIKVICSSPQTANWLPNERVFIANSRILVVKDIQEPIHCNKCQEYRHIHEQYTNEERCSTCVHLHPTDNCMHPHEHHCISCGNSSNHTSVDKSNCP